MDAQATAEILRAFEDMPDPRRHNRQHKLCDILTIAIFAVICGADDWVTVAEYGRTKLRWLKTFLDLPCGIPSHDTFGRVFSRLDPDAFEKCFRQWMKGMVQLAGGTLVAIDGKSLRRSYQRAWESSGMSHMVSAFVEANRMVFSQVSAGGKGQELDAIRRLMELIDLKGAVVSIDAIGCQKSIARQIVDAGADYVLQVKDNQPTLHTKVKALLNEAILDDFEGMSGDFFEETEKDHGRIETRRVWVTWDVKYLGEVAKRWAGLRCLAMVERVRDVDGKVSVERACYISSLDRRRSAARIAGYIRGHWSVENNLHWQLDVSFAEDQRRIRKGHGAENFSRLCRLGLNLLKQERTVKAGIATKRKKCGWDNDYLLKVVTG